MANQGPPKKKTKKMYRESGEKEGSEIEVGSNRISNKKGGKKKKTLSLDGREREKKNNFKIRTQTFSNKTF